SAKSGAKIYFPPNLTTRRTIVDSHRSSLPSDTEGNLREGSCRPKTSFKNAKASQPPADCASKLDRNAFAGVRKEWSEVTVRLLVSATLDARMLQAGGTLAATMPEVPCGTRPRHRRRSSAK